MATANLVRWGNSLGIRIPAVIVKEAHLAPGEELKITTNKNGVITLTPITDPQAGWTEAFNEIADSGDNDLLMDFANDFDKKDWKW